MLLFVEKAFSKSTKALALVDISVKHYKTHTQNAIWTHFLTKKAISQCENN